MADSSLDDFFAKKDKSKKKSKTKFTPTDILAQGEEGQQKKSKKKKEKKKEKEAKDVENKTEEKEKSVAEEEEWEDFEQEQEVDYSGLRIGSLQIGNKEEGEKEKEEEDGSDDEEDGEERKEKREKGSDGPWNKGSGNPSQDSGPAPPPKIEDNIPAGAVSGGKYIPPSRRGLGSSDTSSPAGGMGRRGKKKEAPNITSEMDFPTLGGGPGGGSEGYGGRFEEVRGSGRQYDDPSKRQQQLELGNKFGALQD